MDNEKYTTSDYTKLFLLMVIPIYGFIFTALLAFSKDDIGNEIKSLAKGALIARTVFWVIFLCLAALFISRVLPLLIDIFSELNIFKILL